MKICKQIEQMNKKNQKMKKNNQLGKFMIQNKIGLLKIIFFNKEYNNYQKKISKMIYIGKLKNNL